MMVFKLMFTNSAMVPFFFFSNLNLKLNLTRQHESKSMIGFQNRALDINLLKFHTNWDNRDYLKKRDFQRKFVCQIWGRH